MGWIVIRYHLIMIDGATAIMVSDNVNVGELLSSGDKPRTGGWGWGIT